jgi:ribonuclease Z
MPFEISILGSSSATPATDRHPSAQFLNLRDHCMLIDCGEGTQIQMLHYRFKHSRVNHIFISHLHADHYLGLAALVFTMNFFKREHDLYIIGPEGLKEILEVHFKYSLTELRFPIHYIVTNHEKQELLWENSEFSVHSIPLRHRIPTCGFIFREKELPRKINADQCTHYHVPFERYEAIKNGEDFITSQGLHIPNDELTIDPLPPKAYAYCSDTIYDTAIVDYIKDIDLLYHESTFLHELAERAMETLHTTALQAARIAKAAHVKKLIIGHFSTRYTNLNLLADEARSVFPATELALEGRTFYIESGETVFTDCK